MLDDTDDTDDEDVVVPRRQSPRKSAPKKAPSPPRPPTIALPIPQSQPDYESELLDDLSYPLLHHPEAHHLPHHRQPCQLCLSKEAT